MCSRGDRLRQLYHDVVNDIWWNAGDQYEVVFRNLEYAAQVGMAGIMLYEGDFGYFGAHFDNLLAQLRRDHIYCDLLDNTGFMPRRIYVWFYESY